MVQVIAAIALPIFLLIEEVIGVPVIGRSTYTLPQEPYRARDPVYAPRICIGLRTWRGTPDLSVRLVGPAYGAGYSRARWVRYVGKDPGEIV